MPNISVIVPVYKVEKYLDRCIESIVNQTYPDFELILVDDGSPDNCPVMCDEWAGKDKRICVVHKKNGGASSARNSGLAVAKGNWIAFADSDDWLEKKSLEILYGLTKKFDVSMVIGGMRSVRSYSELSDKIHDEVITLSKKDLLNRFFRINGEPDVHGVWGLLVKREVLKGYHFIEGKMNEDVETSYYLARTCNSAILTNQVLYNYFVNTEGVTNSGFSKKKLDLLDVWDIVQKQVEQYTPEYGYACEMNCKRARFTLLTQMNLNGYDKNDSFMIETKKILKKEVREVFWDLMKWKMPVSRKILLILECI